MCTVETARKILIGIVAAYFTFLFFLFIFGGSQPDPGYIGWQILIILFGTLVFALAFFGALYYFARHCHSVTANELITGYFYKKRQKRIRAARHAPNPIDWNWIMRKIRREIRLAFLQKAQGKKLLARRW